MITVDDLTPGTIIKYRFNGVTKFRVIKNINDDGKVRTHIHMSNDDGSVGRFLRPDTLTLQKLADHLNSLQGEIMNKEEEVVVDTPLEELVEEIKELFIYYAITDFHLGGETYVLAKKTFCRNNAHQYVILYNGKEVFGRNSWSWHILLRNFYESKKPKPEVKKFRDFSYDELEAGMKLVTQNTDTEMTIIGKLSYGGEDVFVVKNKHNDVITYKSGEIEHFSSNYILEEGECQ